MRAAAAATRQLRRVARQRPGAVVGVGARQLGGDVDVGELVLDRLERADGAAEGVALQRIVARHLERRLRAADLLEGEQHGGAILQAPEQALALAGRAEQLGRRAVEGDARVRAARVDRLDRARA